MNKTYKDLFSREAWDTMTRSSYFIAGSQRIYIAKYLEDYMTATNTSEQQLAKKLRVKAKVVRKLLTGDYDFKISLLGKLAELMESTLKISFEQR